MAEPTTAHGVIDWSTAEVRDGELAVQLAGEPTKEWGEHVVAVVERLERHGGRWGDVKIAEDRLIVANVVPGSEADLRHFLEGAVQQANADHAPEPGDDEDEGGSDSDREMTEAFRAFGEPDSGD